MKLSEYKDGEALDLLAELIDPVATIASDKQIAELVKAKAGKLKVVQYVIKSHKEQILQILAAIDGVPVEEYHCNALTLPLKVLEILNDKDLMDFFTSQG